MLYDSYKEYMKIANRLKDWKSMSKTKVANGYCDADESCNRELKDQYFSALILKYWYMIEFWYQTNHNLGLNVEDYYEWLLESLLIGLKYRRWRDSNFAISKDEDGAEKVFNRCLYSTRQRYYKYINRQKRKDNHQLQSLDATINTDTEDKAISFIETLENTDSNFSSGVECKLLVEKMFTREEPLKAILLDAICFQNCFILKQSEYEFSRKKLVKYLHSLNASSVSYYAKRYRVKDERMILNTINEINEMSNKKLSKEITCALWSIKFDKELINYAN